MDNIIKIKTANTDEFIEAVLMEHPNVHVAVYEHFKGTSTYILTTKDIQAVFDFGKSYGIALTKAGKAEQEKRNRKEQATRGKGNEKKHPDEVGRKHKEGQ